MLLKKSNAKYADINPWNIFIKSPARTDALAEFGT
jgi:hypothetical protein